MSSGICDQRMPKSPCASAQSEQDLHCPLTESWDTTECMNVEQKPGLYVAYAQEDLNPGILRMFESMVSLDVIPIIICVRRILEQFY